MSNRTRSSRPRLAGLAGRLVLLFVGAAGCGGGSGATAPPVDADLARSVLRETLDAWKAGKTSDALAGQTPPIRVADEDWLGGFRLVNYEADAKDQLIGDVLRCPVALTLKTKAGKDVKKRVAYNVTTAPSPSVIRQD